MLGERLYPMIARLYQGDDVGKITGMMLEMENSEILVNPTIPRILIRIISIRWCLTTRSCSKRRSMRP